MKRNQTRIEYLEGLLPSTEDELRTKYFSKFDRYATYLGNGVYEWMGIVSKDTRELWLMGVLLKEKIPFEQV